MWPSATGALLTLDRIVQLLSNDSDAYSKRGHQYTRIVLNGVGNCRMTLWRAKYQWNLCWFRVRYKKWKRIENNNLIHFFFNFRWPTQNFIYTSGGLGLKCTRKKGLEPQFLNLEVYWKYICKCCEQAYLFRFRCPFSRCIYMRTRNMCRPISGHLRNIVLLSN